MQPLPLYITPIKAGFPSPADDFLEKKLDLNDYLISHPTSTFFLRAKGQGTNNTLGVRDGDLLVVDRSVTPSNHMVVLTINSDITIRQIQKRGEMIYVLPNNHFRNAVPITSLPSAEIWGVVTSVIRKV
jgi:DNA polymerase V